MPDISDPFAGAPASSMPDVADPFAGLAAVLGAAPVQVDPQRRWVVDD